MSETFKDLEDAGVLARIESHLLKYRGIFDPVPRNIEIIAVETRKDPRRGTEHTSIVVAMIWGGRRVIQRFGVFEKRSFGAAGEDPLTPEQYKLVMSLEKKV